MSTPPTDLNPVVTREGTNGTVTWRVTGYADGLTCITLETAADPYRGITLWGSTETALAMMSGIEGVVLAVGREPALEDAA